MSEKHGGDDAAARHEMPNDFGMHHQRMERFPGADELRELDARWGIDRSLDPGELALRVERHLTRLSTTSSTSARSGSSHVDLFVPFSRARLTITIAVAALVRRRVNHDALDDAARTRFNQALQAAHADGSYQEMAAHHAQDHMMHSSMGPIGTERFLPWHRKYLFELEQLLKRKQPAVVVPYWDYANDHARPDWVWQPPEVVRRTPGATGGSLPSQATIDSIMLEPSYTAFSRELEVEAHNEVHNWCNGTVSSPPTAAQDPIFWLLHANIDRIWDRWQLTHSGVPSLSATDAVLDPWEATAADVNDVFTMGYSYG